MLLQVLKDATLFFLKETGRKLGRAAVATICATTLAMPSVAMATEPEGPEPSTAPNFGRPQPAGAEARDQGDRDISKWGVHRLGGRVPPGGLLRAELAALRSIWVCSRRRGSSGLPSASAGVPAARVARRADGRRSAAR